MINGRMKTVLKVLLIFHLLHDSLSTYDCIKFCACKMEGDVLNADCKGLNFSDVPEPEPDYQVNVLQLQFNRITRLRAGDFLLYANLKELYVQGNKIDAVEQQSFNGLERLEKLDLSKNMISHVPAAELKRLSGNLKWLSISMNALRQIPSGLSSLERVEDLDVSNNRFVTEIDPGSLPSSLLKLDLHYTGVKYFKKSAFDDLKSLKTLLLSDNMASSSLKFESGVFDGLQSLEYMDLSRSFCKKLPRDSFNKLKNLKTLLMNNCWLADPPLLARYRVGDPVISVDARSRKTRFSKEGRNITSTDMPFVVTSETTAESSTPDPDPGIWYNPELTLLDLSNNRRMPVKPGGVRFPASLTELRLGYTRISTIDGNLFNETLSVQKLDLCHTKLRTIARDAFMRFRNVSEICLSGNPLVGAPRLPTSLLTLNLSETKITNLTRLILSGLSSVVEANIRGGEIEWLEDHAFGSMTSMRKLDLSENKIESLQRNALAIGDTESQSKRQIERKSNLDELILSSNVLRKIEAGAFATHDKLQSLDLQGNFLEVIEPGVFRGLISLKMLKLSENGAVDISPHAFNDLNKLEVLNLEDNSLEILFSGTFDGMESLKELHLQRNKLAIVHELAFPSLQYLDISYNNLTLFPSVRGEALREIKASVNPIESFTPGTLRHVTNLQSLDISQCHLSFLNYSVFSEAPSLKELDLTNNFIHNFLDKRMTSLEKLVLGENEIHSIADILNNILPRIKSLDLRYNNITYLNPAVFFGAAHLNRIDLTGNNFYCDCNLQPFVKWMKDHIHVMVEAEIYLCDGPAEEYAMPILDAVGAMDCGGSSTGLNKAETYIVVAVAASLFVFLLMFVACYIRKRAASRRRGDERNHATDSMLAGNEEARQTSSGGCCWPCKECCSGVNDYARERGHRGRTESEERRDLMISSPVTSPAEKEAPQVL